jgi:hypothetical protein
MGRVAAADWTRVAARTASWATCGIVGVGLGSRHGADHAAPPLRHPEAGTRDARLAAGVPLPVDIWAQILLIRPLRAVRPAVRAGQLPRVLRAGDGPLSPGTA